MDIIKQKHKIIKLILISIGVLILLYVIYFIYQVKTIHQQIVSGTYDWAQYGNEVSGKTGSSDVTKTYNLITTDDPIIGAAKPLVTIVEFSDFQCPFSQKAYSIIRAVTAKYPDKVRLIYRDFPLEDIHPLAKLTAQAGYCAQEQGFFWPLHDKIFQNQNKLSREVLIDLAVQSGVEKEIFLTCLDSQAAIQEVNQDVRDGQAAGVVGTPTWFINGYRVPGVIPEQVLENIIQEFIKKK